MAQGRKPRVAVLGSLVFDFVARADRLPRRGETVMGEAFGMFPGGKGANQAVQASRLGAEVALIGRVGDDLLADRLFASLAESGVDIACVKRDPHVATAACCIHVDHHGDNAIIIVPEANMACSEEDVEVARPVIRKADVLLCQLEVNLAAVNRALQVAAEEGVPVILNPAPARPVPEGLFRYATVLTPNETEAEFFSGVPLPQAGNPEGEWERGAARALLGQGPQTVVITLGERGAFMAGAQGERHFPAHRIAAVDVTAAGDAFSGALAVALAEGRALEEALIFAGGAGALAASRPGAQPSLAAREELEAFLAHRRD